LAHEKQRLCHGVENAEVFVVSSLYCPDGYLCARRRMSDVTVRRAERSDAEAIADIYNHYVRTSAATFDTAEKSVDEREQWLEAHGDSHPVLVAQRGEEIVGWGALSPWGSRPGWAHTAETAVYLEPNSTGLGIGPILLDALVEAGREAGHHALLGQIVAQNEASLKIAQRAGFERAGYMREVGFKFGEWVDLVVMQLVL